MKKSLREKNVPAEVYVGMRYWHPFTEEAIEQVPGQMLYNISPGKKYFHTAFGSTYDGHSFRMLMNVYFVAICSCIQMPFFLLASDNCSLRT